MPSASPSAEVERVPPAGRFNHAPKADWGRETPLNRFSEASWRDSVRRRVGGGLPLHDRTPDPRLFIRGSPGGSTLGRTDGGR